MPSPEKKDQTKHESRSHPQDRHVGAQGFENAIEGQRYRKATQGSPNQRLWNDCSISPSTDRWLCEAEEDSPPHFQTGKDKDHESQEAEASSTIEDLKDNISGPVPTKREL